MSVTLTSKELREREVRKQYRQKRKVIRDHLSDIKFLVREHKINSGPTPSYAHVGDLTYVESQLGIIVQFLINED